MTMVPELFGSMVFNDKVMQERLPKSTYKSEVDLQGAEKDDGKRRAP